MANGVELGNFRSIFGAWNKALLANGCDAWRPAAPHRRATNYLLGQEDFGLGNEI
jgi:hypothetical protein